jgi:hypothetical protein
MRLHPATHTIPHRIATLWNWWSESPFTFAEGDVVEPRLSPVTRVTTANTEGFRPTVLLWR